MRNYLFATTHRKSAVVLDATPILRAEPLDNSSTLQLREMAANATRHELERCRWEDLREDQYLTASIGTVGIVMLSTEQDKLSGENKAKLSLVDQTRFYPDPSATRINDCRFVIHEPQMDISDIVEQFPEKGRFVKPMKSQPVGKTLTTNTIARSNDEIINAPGNELSLDVDGNIRQRVAEVAYVWIKDETLTADVQENVLKESVAALECSDCGLRYEPPLVAGCPQCGSQNAEQIEVDAGAEQATTLSRQYPYGRLIVISQDVLLYDGPAPLEIDCVFPFFPYCLYRVPIRFHGYGDVALLKSNQMQADKNMAQLIDAMRLTSMGYLQVPANEPAWGQVTNEPGQKIPTRAENANIAKWITPQSYNAQLHSIADESIYRDFQRISGEPDSSVGSIPTAPEGNASVAARESTRTSRIGKHLKDFNAVWSDIATALWQLMNQYYVGPRQFMAQHADKTFESIVLDVSQMPRGLRIRVEADIDALEKDKLAGQNLVMAMQAGVLPMMPDVLFRAMGTPEAIINEVMQRPEVQFHMAQQQAALMATMGAPPTGATPVQANPSGSPSSPQNSNNGGGM